MAERGVTVSRETVACGPIVLARISLNVFGVTEQFDPARAAITDKLRSYIKPIRHIPPDADHRAHKGLNNAIEVLHRPTRKQEKIFGRFKSQRQAQRFLSAFEQINLILRPRRYKITSISYRHARADALSLWKKFH